MLVLAQSRVIDVHVLAHFVGSLVSPLILALLMAVQPVLARYRRVASRSATVARHGCAAAIRISQEAFIAGW